MITDIISNRQTKMMLIHVADQLIQEDSNMVNTHTNLMVSLDMNGEDHLLDVVMHEFEDQSIFRNKTMI